MINTKTKGELGNRIEYDVEHDLFHPQNVYSEEYITPTFVEYVRKLEQENAELKELKKKKEEIETMTNFCKECKKMHTDQLAQAKEILQPVLDEWKKNRWILQSEKDVGKVERLMKKAENFLKE